MDSQVRYSVIIPALNENAEIGGCIEHVRRLNPAAEIIVADGGSTDGTSATALAHRATVCVSPPGRGMQCNCGAKQAKGDILIFLHADTRLPQDAFVQLEHHFNDERVNVGTFCIAFDVSHWLLDLYAAISRINSTWLRFGDHVIVTRKSLFDTIGGFPPRPLFEDVALLRKARRLTKIHRFPRPVVTSARRFIQNGVIRQQWRNTCHTLQFLAGVPAERLAMSYHHKEAHNSASVIVFARYPQPGKVKTRLAAAIGNALATDFYRRCAAHTLREVRKLSGVHPYLFYSDEGDEARVRRWAGAAFFYRFQCSGDIGERMADAFHFVFRHGAQRAVIVGTDVPDLSTALIQDAFRLLDSNDVVIGPSHDGGYYLLGAKRLYPQIFQGIDWSTGHVFSQTVAALKQSAIKYACLPLLMDIDTAEDLSRWGAYEIRKNRHSKGRQVR